MMSGLFYFGLLMVFVIVLIILLLAAWGLFMFLIVLYGIHLQKRVKEKEVGVPAEEKGLKGE